MREEVNVKLTRDLDRAFRDMGDKVLKVGFFEDAVYPDGTPVATVANAHEYGVEKNNLPPRPFMRQAVIRNEDNWADQAARALKASKKGTIDYANALEQLALMAQADVKDSILRITAPPWSESYRLKREKAKPKSIGKLLIDSGVMLAAVDYRIDDVEIV